MIARLFRLLFLICPSLLFSLTVSQEKIDEQLAAADFKGVIEIEKVEPYDEMPQVGRRSVATARVLSPSEIDFIKIIFFGGEKNERGSFLSGFARPYVGHRYQASLKKIGANMYEVVGFEFGLKDLSPVRAYSRNKTDGSNGDGSGPFLYWDSKYFPIPYFISEPTFRTFPELISEIDQSFITWRNVENIPLEFVAMGCSDGKYNENDGLNSIILITKNWAFDAAAIAITRNFYVAGTSEYSGLILDSDILLNAVDHQFSIGSVAGKHDIRNILTHEVGHFLGLGHEVSPISTEATMYAVASTAETKKQTLSSTDLAGVAAAYQGVGQKLSNHNSFCKTAEQNNGCRLGVKHGRSGFPFGFVLGWIFVLLQIPIGRMVMRRLVNKNTL